ncbi:4Fe-4S double cluster binding domain-containing protein [Eubacteriaceae bacterium ES3]|nr:4Fe-4S double cluster binding domain-containing protein [Eubacteriaceae bacterium ES3]
MKNNQIITHLNELAISLGATELGYSDLMVMDAQDRFDYRYAVTVVVRLANGVIDQIKDEPTHTYFSHYRAVNRLIDHITLRLGLYLESQGFPSMPIPASQSINGDDHSPYSSAFSHKTGAVLSGLGWIGKSALLIHRQYGPRVRLGTILTNAPVLPGTPIKKSQCTSCSACVKVCPALAIEGKNWRMGMIRNELYDAHACSVYMKEAFKHIGRGAVCGLCMAVCPIGKKDNIYLR